jgi:4-hydroxy-2-oxoheptanedioate aldolase
MQNDLKQNKFKRGLKTTTPQIGLWMSLTSSVATEVAAGAGFDWLLIDMEHSANDISEVVQHLRAAEGGTAEPIVRPPWNEPVLVKRLLDQGVTSFLFPFVQSAEEARRAVEATRYPPKGIRGMAGTVRANRWGRVPDYVNRAEAEICVLVQVETRKAVSVVEEIAGVDGVDGVFIGPADLSADFGRHNKWAEPDVWNVILDTGRRIKAAGKSAGFLSGAEKECRGVLEAGFGFVAVGADTGILARQTEALVRMYKG